MGIFQRKQEEAKRRNLDKYGFAVVDEAEAIRLAQEAAVTPVKKAVKKVFKKKDK